MKLRLTSLIPILLIFAGEPQAAIAQDLQAEEPDCASAVGRVICQTEAVRAAYRNAMHVLQDERRFYFGDTAAGHAFAQNELAFWQRNWAENCRITDDLKEEDISGATRSCLLDNIWAASADARCPFVVSLEGVPTADQQHAWFKKNKAFCMKEIEYLYRPAD